MLISRYLRRLCSLLAGAAGLFTATSQAALPANESDLFLCFRATAGLGANTDYIVNLGPASQFLSTTGAVTVDVGGDIAADLGEIYGGDWFSRPDVAWSISGVQKTAGNSFPTNTMFVTDAEASPGTQSDGWSRPNPFAAGAPALKMQAMRDTGYAPGTKGDGSQLESTRSTKALIQSTNAQNSYASYMPGGVNTTGLSAFAYFNAAGTIEATFENGVAASVLDFYKLEPGTGPGVLLGGFRLNESGQLTFNSDLSFFQGPALVKFDNANYPVSEDVAAGKVTLTIARAGNLNSAFSLNVSTADGTAIAGTDYAALTNAPVSFAAGETQKTIDVTITNRAGFQGDRSFTVILAVASGSPQLATPFTATVNIGETTPQPAFLALSSGAYTVAENAAGGTVTVTVNRTGELNSAVTVNLSTQDGTAIAGTDYTGQANTPVSFAATETSKTVDIAVANRAGFQGNRGFSVALSSPSAQAELGIPNTATVTIQENEPNPAGTIAFSAATYQFDATTGGQPTTLIISLTRTNGSTGAVSADVSVTGGTLAAGSDFTFTSPTTVNFADAQTTADVSIPMIAGASPLPGTINLELSNATSGASVGAVGAATVTVNAPVVVIPDRVLPKLTVTSPRRGKSEASFNVVGTVQDPDAINRVEVRLNGGAVQLANLGTVAGTSTPFTLNGLNAENGPNVLTVQAFDVKGTASKVTTIAFIYVNNRPQFAGSYNGLIVPVGVNPPGGNLNNASGFVTLKVTATGAFSGKLLIGGTGISVAGVFANDQTARFKASPQYTPQAALAIKGRPPLPLGDLTLSIAGEEITGAIGTVASLEADRAAFDGKTPATTPDADYLLNKGIYTAVFPTKAQPVLTSTQFPQGDGVGNLFVVKQGKVTFKGRLADGTPLAMSAPLSSDLKAPLFAPLYGKKGSIAGKIVFDKTATDSDVQGADFLWLRPEQLKAKHYVAGWPGGVKVDLVGARYAVPVGASVFPDLDPEDLAAGNATFTAEDGNLTSTVTKTVNVSTANKVTNVPLTDKTFRLAITAKTGALSGFFPHTDGTKTAFAGTILQKGANKGGFGFFLTTVPRNAPAGVSGGISVAAK
jgi:hypothetical protein